MMKLTYCLRRKAGLSWDEFSAYWRDVHAPLVRERAELLGIRRYVQVRTMQSREMHARLQARNGGAPEPPSMASPSSGTTPLEAHAAKPLPRPPANSWKMSETLSTSPPRPCGSAKNGKW